MLEAVPHWRRWQQEIATAVATAQNESEAQLAISAWAERAREDEDIASSLYVATMQGDMAGQLFVRTVEVPESMPTRSLDDRRPPAFLRMTFQEALESFLARNIISPDEFRRLSDAARTRAFTATQLASDALRALAFDRLRAALAEGSTLRDFADALRTEEASLGVTPASPGYLETVYRTNVGASYAAGRYRQITSPEVVAVRPYVVYRNPLDSRTTGICRALAGKIFRQDDPAWPRYAPLNHFSCRSSIVTLRPDAVDERQVTDASTLGPDAEPAPGFDSPPFVTL
jgi:SPP1 gp7 family putative phage head morphogenesis protein